MGLEGSEWGNGRGMDHYELRGYRREGEAREKGLRAIYYGKICAKRMHTVAPSRSVFIERLNSYPIISYPILYCLLEALCNCLECGWGWLWVTAVGGRLGQAKGGICSQFFVPTDPFARYRWICKHSRWSWPATSRSTAALARSRRCPCTPRSPRPTPPTPSRHPPAPDRTTVPPNGYTPSSLFHS